MRTAGKLALIAALAAGSVLAAYALPPFMLLAGAGATVAVAAVLLVVFGSSKRPTAGLSVLLLVAVLVPIEFPAGGGALNVCLGIAAVICGAFLLRSVAMSGRGRLDGSRAVLASLTFAASAIVSFLVGQYQWFPAAHAPLRAQVGGLAVFLVSASLFVVVGHQVTSVRQLRRLTWLFVGSGALAVLTTFSSTFDIRLGSITISNSSSIGSTFWTWLVALSLGQALFNAELRAPARAAAGGVAMLALGRGLFDAFSWTSGWLPPLVAVAVLLLFRFPRAAISIVLLGVTPALLYAGPFLQTWMVGESHSAVTRIEAARVMWKLIEQNPWLGFGPANYYHYTHLFPILGWWVAFSSHNNYVDLMAQTGLVGLLAFGWFVAEVLRLAVRLLHRTGRGFERAYLLSAIAGLAGSLVSGLLGDWIVPFAYNVGVRGFRSSMLLWFFLGGVVALKRIASGSLGGVHRHPESAAVGVGGR